MTYRNFHARWSCLLLGICLALSTGCGGQHEAGSGEEVTRAAQSTSTGQALSSTPPTQDPQLCVLPSGRYVVSAAVTNTQDVYNVTFHNDGVEGSQPSASCKTMKLIWDTGIPYPALPPQPPAEADFPKALLEGWWDNSASVKRFAVKAVWMTNDQLGVITQIAGVSARGYLVAPGDLGASTGWRFNWTGAGSDTNHMKYIFPFPIYSYGEIFITDQADVGHQSLYCQSGTTRLFGGDAFNCPLIH